MHIKKLLLWKFITAKKFREATEEKDIFFVSLINSRNGTERKDAYGRVISVFLKTRFGKWLFGLRNTIVS